ncbi:hypothetical protein NVS55_39110 [Myxococcus stipitatus]|uniref:hypothetical protein n=1 Tax=Myxococcus stipitatus TaxID=83455 RepID=UPI003145011B
MVGKLAWMALVVASLSVMLCAGGCSAKAQPEAVEPADAPKSRGTSAAQPTPGEMSELWNSVAGLRAEVLQLRREVATLRAQVKDSARSESSAATEGAGARGTSSQGKGDASAQGATSEQKAPGGAVARGTSSEGTGGAGAQGTASRTGEASAQGASSQTGGEKAQGTSSQSGEASAQGTASQTGGATAQSTSSQEARGPDTGTGGAGAQAPATEAPQPASPSGRARVTATYRGTVRSVIPPEVVIAQADGSALTLDVSPRAMVVGPTGKRIDLSDLGPGDRVRAVVDMVGQHETVEISVLRKEDAGE